MATPRIDKLERNLAINGAFDFWQRVGSSVTTVSANVGGYAADRMRHTNLGSAKAFTASRSSDVPAGIGAIYSYLVTCTQALTNYAAADLIQPLRYIMEGYDFAPLNGKQITVGFWVKSSKSGKLGVTYLKYVTASTYESYVTWVDIASSEVNTWVFRSVTTTLSATPHDTGSSAAFQVSIGGYAGADRNTTNYNVWESGVKSTGADFINFTDSTSNVLRIAGLQIVAGSTPLPSERIFRSGGTVAGELALCQRYYETSYDLNLLPGTAGGSGHVLRSIYTGWLPSAMDIPFKVTKRHYPTMTLYSTATAATTGVASAYNSGGSFLADYASITSAVGFNGFLFGSSNGFYPTTAGNNLKVNWTADAEL